MTGVEVPLALVNALLSRVEPPSMTEADRLRAMVNAHHDLVWRLVRRLGLPGADADDIVQQAFIVASRRLDTITEGKERAFLISTALHEVAHHRRSRQRRREIPDDEASAERSDAAPGPDELLERSRARDLLDEILGAMPLELRTVFVLFEYEQMGTPEIAALLGIPVGTASSRLRRAREAFQQHIDRLRARGYTREGRR